MEGRTILGLSMEEMRMRQTEEERQQAEVVQKLGALGQLLGEFAELKRAHAQLALDIQAFGVALGLTETKT